MLTESSRREKGGSLAVVLRRAASCNHRHSWLEVGWQASWWLRDLHETVDFTCITPLPPKKTRHEKGDGQECYCTYCRGQL